MTPKGKGLTAGRGAAAASGTTGAEGGLAARYLYYPGCSLHSTAQEFNDSAEALFAALGIEYEEVEDWNCCGATPAHATSEFLTGALPLRNLILAEKQAEGWEGGEKAGSEAETGADTAERGAPVEILVPCAACYNSFRLAEHEVREGGERGEELNREVGEIMGRTFKGGVTVKHPLEVLSGSEVAAKAAALVKRPLTGLKVACYYGCLLGRPSKIVSFETNPENPTSMDEFLRLLGADPVRWSYKTDCCGQSMAVAESGLVTELTNRICKAAREAGAHALVTACPLCMMNLDSRQKPGAVEGAAGGAGAGTGSRPATSPSLLPVFFFTELAGLAMGVGRPESWFKRHLIDVKPALDMVEARKSA